MTDQTSTDIADLYRRPRQHIELASDTLQPRREFADELGISDKTAARMNLPTTYIGNVAYIARNASLEIIAGKVRRRNGPPKRRRSSRG